MNDRIARYVALIEDEASLLEQLGQRIGDGEGLSAICKAWDVPYGRVLYWLMADAKRYEVYLRALEVAAHAEIDEAKRIADTPQLGIIKTIKADGTEEIKESDMLGHRKLQVETRFRRAKSHAPGLYGEKEGTVGSGVTVIVNRGCGQPDTEPVILDDKTLIIQGD